MFQSTRPARGATRQRSDWPRTYGRFNPRAPRGARLTRAEILERGSEVSIHAPRAGRDRTSPELQADQACFNPRAPRGARRQSLGGYGGRVEFQSTRPARGATSPIRNPLPLRTVSIHAPRAGRDSLTPATGIRSRCFNPRAPRGARPSGRHGAASPIRFQSTRPARGATEPWRRRARMADVSIHAPRAGRDDSSTQGGIESLCFNPRAPRGARQRTASKILPARNVSIHAPRAGRDRAC